MTQGKELGVIAKIIANLRSQRHPAPGAGSEPRHNPLFALGRHFGESLQDRQQKRSGFSGPCLGATKDILALEKRRDGFRLNGGRAGVASVRHRTTQRLDQIELIKSSR